MPKNILFVNIKKSPKMAKWPNHFISGKQFQKRPNGNPDEVHLYLLQNTQVQQKEIVNEDKQSLSML